MIFGLSKTTINGVLALLITVGLALLASGSPLIGPTATAVITLVLGVLRAVVGFLQNDAPPPTPNLSSKLPPAAVLALLALFLALPSLTGCKSQAPPSWATTAPALTVPGELIAGANYAVTGYEKDAAAGVAYTQNATLKAVITDLQVALTVAQPAFNAWETALKANAAAPEPAALSTSLTTIQADIAKLPAQLQGN